jgi:PAT family beta-lactamase induction signal transducer AmpG
MLAVRRWGQSFTVYAHPRVWAMLFLGFSAGLPFPLVLTTLSARLRQAGIDRTTIGYFSLVGLAYSLKYFWSPVVDRMPLPLLQVLGRRRSWMLLAQCSVACGILLLALGDPAVDPVHIAWLAVFTAFAAATQDIAVDAYRIEAVGKESQGAMAATYQIGYQLALICGGAGALAAAAGYGWSVSYSIMAGCVAVGIVTTLVIAEPETMIDRSTLALAAIPASSRCLADRCGRVPLC